MTLRAKIYTRYSTDKQRETSIDDQLRVGRARIATEGWQFAGHYSDAAVSGMSAVANRPGGAMLMADALAGGFEVLVLEGLDRLARDLVEQERIVRRLEHIGIRLVGVSDGYDSQSKAKKLHRGMRGMINEIYLDDLREKVHRGLAGQFARGLSAGGLPYGYRSVAREKGRDLEINPDEARWVIWMFEQFARGLSTREITHRLNARGVTARNGGTWAHSALYGHPKYQTGILRNAIYIGRYIWNRTKWEKDPETHTRKRRERPQSEWMVEERPHLRIVSDALWHAAQARLTRKYQPRGRAPRTMLSGLLRCGDCGGAVVAVSTRYYGCAARKDRGPTVCAGVRAERGLLEGRIYDVVRDDLLSEEALSDLRAEMTAAATVDARARKGERAELVRRLAAAEREVANLVDVAARATWSDAIAERLKSTEATCKSLRTELDRAVEPITLQLIPGLLDKYRQLVNDLPQTLARAPDEARAALKDIVGEIRLVQDGKAVYAEISAFGVIRNVVAGDRSGRSNLPKAPIKRFKVA
jgi:site-specific DNA recombinase